MKPKRVVAAILIVLGVAAFAYQGIVYTTRGRDVSFGRAGALLENAYDLPLLPIIGAVALIGGIALLLVDKQDFKRAATP